MGIGTEMIELVAALLRLLVGFVELGFAGRGRLDRFGCFGCCLVWSGQAACFVFLGLGDHATVL